jgi:hypothetical protein
MSQDEVMDNLSIQQQIILGTAVCQCLYEGQAGFLKDVVPAMIGKGEVGTLRAVVVGSGSDD